MATVLVSTALPGDAFAQLALRHTLHVGTDPGGLGREGILKLAREHPEAAAVISLLSDRLDAELFGALPSLRVVANYAVGVDNIDLHAAARHGVTVCNTPDVLTDATADFTLALLLACTRHVVQGDALVRAGQWRGWAPSLLLGPGLAGKTLGIIGLGRIGRAVAQRARGFGLHVVASVRDPATVAPIDGIEIVTREALLARSDIVSLHCPLTAETRQMIDRGALARMKPGAVLINVARGALIDEGALCEALDQGHLGGAGLDVFVNEPHVTEAIRQAPRTVLAPHLGSADIPTRTAMANLACRAVEEVLAGRTVPNAVAVP